MELNKKISTLSTIPEWAIDKFQKYINLVHSHDIVEQILEDKNVFEIDLWEGKLYIKLEDDTLKYKFIPSEDFNETVKTSVIKKKSRLVDSVTDKLKTAITNTYKDII